jgi:hypothetical protein
MRPVEVAAEEAVVVAAIPHIPPCVSHRLHQIWIVGMFHTRTSGFVHPIRTTSTATETAEVVSSVFIHALHATSLR